MKIKRMHAGAILPTRATEQSAGYDLYADLDAPLTLAQGEIRVVKTGVAVALPAQTVGLIFGRSGLGVKHGVVPANAVGVIDADYRGELMVGLTNHGPAPYVIRPGERIAQLVVVPILTPALQEVEALDDTARGTQGFGSSGRQ